MRVVNTRERHKTDNGSRVYIDRRLCFVPIYEYKCAECGKVFEAFQKMSDAPLTECKFCRGSVERLISHTSFQFKGGGWYVTDYAKRSESSTTAAPKSNGAEKSSESKSDSASKDSEKSSGSNTSADQGSAG